MERHPWISPRTRLHGWKAANLRARGLRPGTRDEKSRALAAAHQLIQDSDEEVKTMRKAAAAVDEAVTQGLPQRPVAEPVDDGVRVTRACREPGGSTSGYHE